MIKDERLNSINSISNNKVFQKTALFKSFKERPLGFIDIGAAGGVHPLISPVASLTHCTCFEPDENACQELSKKYAKENPFSKITILNSAVGDKTGDRKLYLTKSAVNTSLLEPRDELVTRYKVSGFQLQKVMDIKTRSLDEVVFSADSGESQLGEFIKMDCQGAEYHILEGSRRVLREQCVALMCELEFFPMYNGQKTFSEVDLFLRNEGFQLYGLYPGYISTRKIDRRKYDSDERIIWADALYFKDPLDNANKQRKYSVREIEVLLLVTILTRYYDYALELVDNYFDDDEQERDNLHKLILLLAEGQKIAIEDDLARLIVESQKSPEKSYLLAKKFIDKHKSNNNIDFINV